MATEIELIRQAFPAPDQDPEAKERARARLRVAMTSELTSGVATGRPRSAARPVKWLGLVAAVLVAAVLLAQTLIPHGRGGSSASAQATAQLRRLASLASSSGLGVIPAGKFLYLASESSSIDTTNAADVSNVDVTTGLSFDLLEKETVQTWIAPDGSGRRTTTVTSVAFPTDKDRQAWLDMGSPPLDKVGEAVTEPFGPGELTGHRDLSALPTDPTELAAALRIPPQGEGTLDDEQVMGDIADLLSSANPDAALRAALYKVLADLPGIRSLGRVQDPLGRTGEGFVLPQGSTELEIVVDPSTSDVMANIITNVGTGALRFWVANTASGVVSRPGVKA